MFEAPLHPKVVHLPIALSILMPLVSIGLLAAWWNSWLPRRSWFLAVGLQALLFGGAWVATETGETDEEKVEKILQSEEPLEEHEEAANQFFWATLVVLGLMALPLILPRRNWRRLSAAVAVGGTLVVLWLGIRVGDAGGKLVYEHGAADAHVKPAADAPTPAESEDEHEDD